MQQQRASSVNKPLNTKGYPPELFDLPKDFIVDQNLRTLHAEVCARLLADHPDADMLDVLTIERVATSYFYVRQRESSKSEPVGYRSLMRMWLEISAELRKRRFEALSEAATREKVSQLVGEALNHAIYGLDPVIAGTVRAKMVEALEGMS